MSVPSATAVSTGNPATGTTLHAGRAECRQGHGRRRRRPPWSSSFTIAPPPPLAPAGRPTPPPGRPPTPPPCPPADPPPLPPPPPPPFHAARRTRLEPTPRPRPGPPPHSARRPHSPRPTPRSRPTPRPRRRLPSAPAPIAPQRRSRGRTIPPADRPHRPAGRPFAGRPPAARRLTRVRVHHAGGRWVAAFRLSARARVRLDLRRAGHAVPAVPGVVADHGSAPRARRPAAPRPLPAAHHRGRPAAAARPCARCTSASRAAPAEPRRASVRDDAGGAAVLPRPAGGPGAARPGTRTPARARSAPTRGTSEAAFTAMEPHLRERRDVDVHLTWDVDRLPAYGERVVAVVLGDESGTGAGLRGPRPGRLQVLRRPPGPRRGSAARPQPDRPGGAGAVRRAPAALAARRHPGTFVRRRRRAPRARARHPARHVQPARRSPLVPDRRVAPDRHLLRRERRPPARRCATAWARPRRARAARCSTPSGACSTSAPDLRVDLRLTDGFAASESAPTRRDYSRAADGRAGSAWRRAGRRSRPSGSSRGCAAAASSWPTACRATGSTTAAPIAAARPLARPAARPGARPRRPGGARPATRTGGRWTGGGPAARRTAAGRRYLAERHRRRPGAPVLRGSVRILFVEPHGRVERRRGRTPAPGGVAARRARGRGRLPAGRPAGAPRVDRAGVQRLDVPRVRGEPAPAPGPAPPWASRSSRSPAPGARAASSRRVRRRRRARQHARAPGSWRRSAQPPRRAAVRRARPRAPAARAPIGPRGRARCSCTAPSAVVAVSDFTAEQVQRGPRRARSPTRVYNSVDLARFDPDRVDPAGRARASSGIAPGSPAARPGRPDHALEGPGHRDPGAGRRCGARGLDAHLAARRQDRLRGQGRALRQPRPTWRELARGSWTSWRSSDARPLPRPARRRARRSWRALDLSLLPSWEEPFGARDRREHGHGDAAAGERRSAPAPSSCRTA